MCHQNLCARLTMLLVLVPLLLLLLVLELALLYCTLSTSIPLSSSLSVDDNQSSCKSGAKGPSSVWLAPVKIYTCKGVKVLTSTLSLAFEAFERCLLGTDISIPAPARSRFIKHCTLRSMTLHCTKDTRGVQYLFSLLAALNCSLLPCKCFLVTGKVKHVSVYCPVSVKRPFHGKSEYRVTITGAKQWDLTVYAMALYMA